MTAETSQIKTAVAAYAAAWAEPDPRARAALLERAVTDDVRVVTGSRAIVGRAALSADVDELHRRIPAIRVRLSSAVEVLGNLCRFSGVVEGADGALLGQAFDTCECDEGGRLKTVFTFPTVPKPGG